MRSNAGRLRRSTPGPGADVPIAIAPIVVSTALHDLRRLYLAAPSAAVEGARHVRGPLLRALQELLHGQK